MHRDLDRRGGSVDIDPHASTRLGELDGIGEQVDQHLANPERVGVDPEIRLVPEFQRDARVAGERLDLMADLVQQRCDRHLHDAEIDATRLDPGQVDHVVDQPQQVAAAPLDRRAEVAGPLLGQRPEHRVGDELRGDQDRVERGPQLVRHRAQEIVLRVARPSELRVGLVELLDEG